MRQEDHRPCLSCAVNYLLLLSLSLSFDVGLFPASPARHAAKVECEK